MNNDLKQNQLSDFFNGFYELSPEKRVERSIQVIIQKLSEQSLSVMVGAGFSKNANNDYPSWAALLFDAYKEMHQKEIKKKNKETEQEFKKRIITDIQNKGEPNIAEEYEIFKGKRESLDLYIEKQLEKIDTKKTQLETHKALLSLNWCDVITTNWDTLLEEARTGNEYSIVKEAKELKVSNKKRIVKINGSLRDKDDLKKLKYEFDGCLDHLYIITKKDFNNYIQNHEGFSNFMKVKMLENSFCLFGFSGNDYNFRYWMSELKRTMIKGGITKNPNPIFLFYIDKEPIRKDLEQFYKNNYIVPIGINEFFNRFLNTSINTQQSELTSEITTIKTPEIFIKIFEYLKKETEIKEKTVEKTPKKEDNSYNLLSSFSFSKDNLVSEDFIKKYNKLEFFNYNSIVFSDYSFSKIQDYFANLHILKKEHYIFLYYWCLNNYYSLSNLFEKDVIERIINKYKENEYYRTEAYLFVELILKYYRETNQVIQFDNFCGISKTVNILNIINYEKGLLLKDLLKYEELDKLIKKWTPEKKVNPDSLIILRKISLIFALNNPRFFNDTLKNKVNGLFLLALKNCKEEQLKYFIICFYRYYLFSVNQLDSFKLQKEFEILKGKKAEPRDYLRIFIKNEENKIVKPNALTRYIITYPLFSSENNNSEHINRLRYFNFFEYTGLTMCGFVYDYEMINLITVVKKWKHLLRRCFVYCISFFGDSSEEYFLRTAVPLILRNFDEKGNENLFSAAFAVLEYKTFYNQNIRSDIFLLSEIARRVNKEVAKKYYDYFLKEIFNSKKRVNQIINGIKRGHIWGIRDPFLQCLGEINEKNDFIELLKWIMQEYIKEEQEQLKAPHKIPSEFLTYYQKLVIQRSDKEELLSQFFKDKDVQLLLSEDMKLTKQLSLYAYKFVNEEIKKELLVFLEKAYSIKIDPFFITCFRSQKIKEQILSEIEKKDILIFDSRDYPIKDFIFALNQANLLNVEDRTKIITIYSRNYEKIKSNSMFAAQKKDFIKEFFIILETIVTKKEKTVKSKIKETYEKIKTDFLDSIKDFYNFEWLYFGTSQEFKQNFIDALTYFSYLREAAKYLYVFNASLTKILVQDNNDFEAVIGHFINCYEKYEDRLFINNETKEILLQIMKKFKMAIPDCYDDLFIKKEMKLLANKMALVYNEDDIIEYWKYIEIN